MRWRLPDPARPSRAVMSKLKATSSLKLQHLGSVRRAYITHKAQDALPAARTTYKLRISLNADGVCSLSKYLTDDERGYRR